MNWIKEYLRYGWHVINGFRARHEQMLADRRQRDIAPFLDDTSCLRVLDLANGQLRPQVTLLRAAGHHVVGIDLVNRPPGNLLDLAYILVRRLYTWKLGVAPALADSTGLVCGNVNDLPYLDDTFDLVTSIAAFEHFLNIPAVIDELHRILRPGGVVWAGIHLYTAPSGGHNVSLTEIPLCTIPVNTDPWDHLRHRRLPLHVPLNEWRRSQYLEAFEQRFQLINHYCAMREGKEFLTPDLEKELVAYSRDELTCAMLVIVARKPSNL